MTGRPSNLDYSGLGPTALAVGADGVVFDIFFLVHHSLLLLPLSGR